MVSQFELTVTDAAGMSVNARALLAAIATPAAGQPAFLTESGRAGMFVWDDSDLSAMVTIDTAQGIFIAPASDVTGASGAWVRKFDGDVSVLWFGAQPDGPTNGFDSAPAIMVADAVARALTRTLSFSGIFRIRTTLSIANRTEWRFQGSHSLPGDPHPGSYILKDGNLHGPAAHFTGQSSGSIVRGGTIIADPTNAIPAINGGDGYLVETVGIRLLECGVQGVARDGLRLGDSVGTLGINANSLYADGFSAAFCGQDGLHIDDALVAPQIDANTFLFNAPKLFANGRHGFYAKRTYLGGTVVGGLFEANGTTDATGRGIYLDTEANGLVFVGGDNEANAGGQVYEAIPRANRIIEMSVQGVVWNNMQRRDTWTPVAYGATAAGSGAYSRQNGMIALNGSKVTFWVRLTWTGHTGTGSLYVSLPPAYAPSAASTNFDFLLVNAGLSGTDVKGVLSPNGNFIRILTPAMADFAIPASGDLFLSGSYEVAPGVAAL